MSSESLKSWLDAMPIDDVRRKIERLEAKLADLRVLERIYGERHAATGASAAAEESAPAAEESAPAAEESAPAAEDAAPSEGSQPEWGAPQG